MNNEARCETCGIPWMYHAGLTSVCVERAALAAERNHQRNKADNLREECKDLATRVGVLEAENASLRPYIGRCTECEDREEMAILRSRASAAEARVAELEHAAQLVVAHYSIDDDSGNVMIEWCAFEATERTLSSPNNSTSSQKTP